MKWRLWQWSLKDFRIQQIPREENKQADVLANLAFAFDFVTDSNVPLVFLWNLSIDITKINICQTVGPIWIYDIANSLESGKLPFNEIQTHQIRYRLARFCLLWRIFYKRSFSGPFLRCLRADKADYVLRKIHEGLCCNHSRARS